MRSKAYYLKILLHTYNMVIRPIENFLQALEVEPLTILALKKSLKTWTFESFAGFLVLCVENKYIP